MPFTVAGVCARPCESLGMKKHIRNMLDDLKKKRDEKDYIPPIPAAPTDGKVIDLDAELSESQEPPCDPDERETRE
jgi:hypothetical protein